MTSATSGEAAATGVESNNNVANSQIAGAVTGGGSGSAAAGNTYDGKVADAGTASAKSGFAGSIGGDANATVTNDSGSVSATASSGKATAEPSGTSALVSPTPSPTISPTPTPVAQPVQSSPTPTAPSLSGTSATSSTSASSGNAQAVGVQSQNSVATTSIASALVNGINQGIVQVTTSVQVLIQSIGIGASSSGNATAVGGNASASLSTLPSAPSTSVPSSQTPATQTPATDSAVTGLTANPSINAVHTVTAVLDGNKHNETLASTQAVIISNQGAAAAQTTPAEGSAQMLPTSSTSSTSDVQSTTIAKSGDAEAIGVQAQNNFAAFALGTVIVRGNNYSPISVLVETIVRIVNVGGAYSKSGVANARGAEATAAQSSGSSPSASAQTAASGNATATGVKATNDVQAINSAQIVVQGDNRTPLNLFVEMFAGVFNFGSAVAASGAATANGGATASSTNTMAKSGHATARGLQVVNNLDISAYAGILVNGSNFAPITLTVRLVGDVLNFGVAKAVSGDADAAGSSAQTTSSQSAASTNEPRAGSELQAPSLIEATTTASPMISPNSKGSAQRNIISQSENRANGNSIAVAGSTSSNHSYAARQAAASGTGSGGVAASALSATTSRSGDVHAVGISNQTSFSSTQIADVPSTGAGKGLATNEASFSVETMGIAEGRAGNAATGSIVDSTPTPVPGPDSHEVPNEQPVPAPPQPPKSPQIADSSPTVPDESYGGSGLMRWTPWPYPYALGMPGLTRRLAKANGVTSLLPISTATWRLTQVTRPAGLITGLANPNPAPMPGMSLPARSEDARQVPGSPWLNLILLVGGVASVASATGYRYRRRIKPFIHAIISSITSAM